MSTSHFLIGGSRHGELVRLQGWQVEFRVALPPPGRYNFNQPPFSSICDFRREFPEERYVMHVYGLEVNGVKTQRRARYLVLDCLAREEGERLIDMFENENSDDLLLALR